MVSGTQLTPGTLRDQLGEDLMLLVFLRHLGCIFCRQTLAELRAASEELPDYPEVLLFFQGSPTQARAQMRSYWPNARVIADPEREFYALFGLERSTLRQSFGLGPLRARQRARAKGHTQGSAEGDVWQMPGTFLVRGERVLWSHEYRHAGDLPDFRGIAARARDLRDGS